jgi:hypothetical protein
VNQKRGCLYKRRYVAEIQARCVAVKLREKKGRNLRPYSCPYCLGFHLVTVR